jgi:hypothetical protein
MSHEKKLHDGKLRKEPTKSLKERRLEKKAKHTEEAHLRKPRARSYSTNAG